MSVLNISVPELTFAEFIKDFEDTLKDLFQVKNDINELSHKRGLPANILEGIMSKQPLSVAIPKCFGGRGGMVKECLGLLSAASYQSLPLSLTFGINIALFLEPVSKYANELMKSGIFSRFLERQNMGGLMITEPAYGSDALNMKTCYMEYEDKYHIQGTKHWQGLTGMADYWLMTARKTLPNGELARDIDFFICDSYQDNQQIEVLEYYDNLGLYMIPYGLNKVDVEVPKLNRLEPESTGLKMMLDILHRSRMQFPGMGMGFLKRMLDEAVAHCQNRYVGSGNLLSYDQVQYQISRMQAAYTICSAMCARSCDISGTDNNVASEGLEANSMKALVTDLMQESSQLLMQLSGANGYRISHIGGRGTLDSRPFQIFEGSNEMLYTQIADIVLRDMRKKKANNLLEYLSQNPLTTSACVYVKDEMAVSVDGNLPQRKQIDLGRALAKLINMGYVLKLEDKGYNRELVASCIAILRQDISCLMSSFAFNSKVNVVECYSESSNWLAFA
ncbi:acyl-CoA dehydrogenase family protein [Olivibacter sitiensis]|uniref:acyl-CoA dehydrogenase family protein n=1 Tax=Olivibacter sitiensis TaxID=376470 RepID=UPI0003F62542|nr:acyl-CoA dehydrogenase [Olivibacter sitiensis]